jgi:broad specificity phosphatase PhoE
MELILVRHGETAWNVEQVFRGTIDVELNETGIRQARLLAEYLKDRPVTAVYSSPLQRALKTAEEIANQFQQEVKITRGLIDIDFGAWNGLSVHEVEEKYPDLYKEWTESPEKVEFPYGESLEAVAYRAKELIDSIVYMNSGTVVAVSHRVVLKTIICALLGLDNSHFWNVRLDTCGITVFSYENGKYTLCEHNNTSFLKPLGAEKLADF